MQSSNEEIAPNITSIRPLDFSFINHNNQIINSLQHELKRPSNKKIGQNIENRGYQLTFKKPQQAKFDYTSIKRLQIFGASFQQKLKIKQEQVDNEQQLNTSITIEKKQIYQNPKKTSTSIRKKYIQEDDQEQTQKSQKNVTKRISKIMRVQNKQQFVQLNCLLPNVYQDEVYIRRGSQDFKKLSMNVCGNNFINFQKNKFDLDGINKVKIYPQKQKGKCFKIKLVHKKIQYFLNVQLRRDLFYLPKHYVWFAKLINSRLIHAKYKIQIKDGNKLVDTNYGLGGDFAKGYIYKFSKYKKKWQKRYVVINTQGIFSYLNPADNYTISIPTEQIKQLWTNFQTVHNHLIIKLAYNKHDKIEFAIPIQDYCLREESNWLFPFYRILMEHTIHIKCICG